MIKNYLEYQEIDYELYKLERELKDSEERKNYSRYKKYVQDATEQLQKLNAESEELLNGYDKLISGKAGCAERIKEIEDVADGIEALEELRFYQTKYAQLDEAMATLEREVARVMARIEEIKFSCNDAMEKGRRATVASKEARAAYDQKAEQYRERMDELKAKLAKIAPKLKDAKLTEHYKRMREDKKMPVFVNFNLSGKSCGKCGMELVYGELAKLKEPGDWIECSNCRRILYVE